MRYIRQKTLGRRVIDIPLSVKSYKALSFLSLLIIVLAISGIFCWARQKVHTAGSSATSSMQRLTTMAWIYPGAPACNALNEFSDGRRVTVLKPLYFNLLNSGNLQELNVATVGCNGYSPANISLIKQYSQKQFVLVSGVTAGVTALTDASTKMTDAINTLTTFVTTNRLTGIELDFEAVSDWSGATYQNFLAFVTHLGNALHAQNKQLMLDGPAITSAGYPNWKYEDFKNLPVDYLVAMAYDYQYGPGIGSPVSPLSWIHQVVTWMKTTIEDPNRIVIGLPSYGYHGPEGQSRPITNDTYAQTQQVAGYQQATRDSASGELFFTHAGTFYDYSDSQTLDMKRQVVINAGIKNISVWHLGGNQWFSN